MRRLRFRSPRPRLALAAGLIAAGAMTGLSPVVHAATTSVGCSDAALITAINGHASGDTLSLASGCTYTLTTANSGADGLPVISDSLTIDGNGATIARSSAGGTPAFRLLDVEGSGDVTLNNLTLTRGDSSGSGGGALLDEGSGTLTVADSVLSESTGGDGGGLFADGGPVRLIASTVTNNTGVDGGGVAFEGSSHDFVAGSTLDDNTASTNGGGLHNDSPVTVINSTIANNTAPTGGGYFDNGGAATFVNDTIADNSATTTRGGGIELGGSTTTLTNVLMADNSPQDCVGTLTDDGGNMDTDGSCSFGGVGNDADADLGSLQNNGGPTDTMLPGASSTALGNGVLSGCNAALPSGAGGIDQRGDPRGNITCDMGAVEVQPANSTVPTATATPTGTGVPIPVTGAALGSQGAGSTWLALGMLLAGAAMLLSAAGWSVRRRTV